jgi:hypothetical protein
MRFALFLLAILTLGGCRLPDQPDSSTVDPWGRFEARASLVDSSVVFVIQSRYPIEIFFDTDSNSLTGYAPGPRGLGAEYVMTPDFVVHVANDPDSLANGLTGWGPATGGVFVQARTEFSHVLTVPLLALGHDDGNMNFHIDQLGASFPSVNGTLSRVPQQVASR